MTARDYSLLINSRQWWLLIGTVLGFAVGFAIRHVLTLQPNFA